MQTKRAAYISTQAKQANQHDEKQQDVGNEPCDEGKFDAPDSTQNACDLGGYPYKADLRRME